MIVSKNELFINETVVFDKTFDIALDDVDQGSLQLVYTNASAADKTFADTDVDPDEDTITIASHGYITGNKLTKITTDGTLPAGLDLLTAYYVIKVDDNTIKLAASLADAKAGTAVDITDAGSSGATNTIDAPALGTVTAGVWFSNDGVNFQILETATAISAGGHKLWFLVDKFCKYLRVAIAIDAGGLGLKGYLFGKKNLP